MSESTQGVVKEVAQILDARTVIARAFLTGFVVNENIFVLRKLSNLPD